MQIKSLVKWIVFAVVGDDDRIKYIPIQYRIIRSRTHKPSQNECKDEKECVFNVT